MFARNPAILGLTIGYDAFRVRQEIDQEVEDLRLDYDRLGAAPAPAARDIEDRIAEHQSHAISMTRQGTDSGLARFTTK